MNSFSDTLLWRYLREKKIIFSHRKVAAICERLVSDYYAAGDSFKSVQAKRQLDSEKIIWQYWAQGYDDLPPVVKECLDSVDKYCLDYRIIRLRDTNLEDYLVFPDWLKEQKGKYSIAFFSDLLRLMLLREYGGIWMDATIMLSGPIPKDYLKGDFFLFQRDVNETHKDYWENTYAYYFSWAKGFRVNMLSSFMHARKHTQMIDALCGTMLKWWKENDSQPDYFFLQILYDVLAKGEMKKYKCPVVNDCLPHYLQQYRNDPKFSIATKEWILSNIPIHKMTYK